MKKVLVLAVTFLSAITIIQAQNYYMTRNGNIKFDCSTSMENIQASNHKVSSVMDISTGNIEFGVLINAFEFEKDLMQQHFNENYMESEKFPKSTFKGTITNNKDVNYAKDGVYNVKVTGKLTMHGVSKDVLADGVITIKGGKISASAKFTATLADYNIEIPSLVKDKISKDVKIVVDMNYDPYVKG